MRMPFLCLRWKETIAKINEPVAVVSSDSGYKFFCVVERLESNFVADCITDVIYTSFVFNIKCLPFCWLLYLQKYIFDIKDKQPIHQFSMQLTNFRFSAYKF